jgi:hypothetical protein
MDADGIGLRRGVPGFKGLREGPGVSGWKGSCAYFWTLRELNITNIVRNRPADVINAGNPIQIAQL